MSTSGAIRNEEKTMLKVMFNFEWVLVELRMPRLCYFDGFYFANFCVVFEL